jgi:hypothetical protein
MREKLLFALALGLAGSAWAQAPAPAAGAAAKPTMPKVCMSCHKPAPGEVSGYFDNVAVDPARDRQCDRDCPV